MDIQTEINRLAKELSPKTVRNRHGFISAVLSVYNPSLKINTTLPQKIKKGNPHSITDFLSRAQKTLDMPHFSIHTLRHYFASRMSAMNIPDEDIMRFGGWETDYVMKNVYRHAMQDKNNQAQRAASQRLGSILF